jgi:AbrB family transcriptional regulator (stage V sporulation protein T)
MKEEIIMVATGIVRRIDELGRVVIPREIRQRISIKEGDPLEIYLTKENEVVLKKYSVVEPISIQATSAAQSLYRTFGGTAIVTDKEKVITASGSLTKRIADRGITKELLACIENRQNTTKTWKDSINLVISQDHGYEQQVICPIIADGSPVGAVVLINSDSKHNVGETEEVSVSIVAQKLGREIEC